MTHSENIELVDDFTVKRTTIETEPRYELVEVEEVGMHNAEDDLEYVHSLCRIRTLGHKFKCFSNEVVNINYSIPTDDLEIFKNHIKETYGDHYDCTILLAIVHGDATFYTSDVGEKRCNFDSGVVGFIAKHKNESKSFEDICAIMDDCYNGYYTTYEVYDKYSQDVVDMFTYCGRTPQQELNDWKKVMKEKYQITK